MTGELDGLPYATAYEAEITKEIEVLNVDLTTGRNVVNWESYKAKVAARAAFMKAKSLFRETIKKATKGELDGE
jgi:hypothetical protein